MDAGEPKSRLSRIERLVAALLAVVLAAGLWQGYASWLLGGVRAG
jgi:hypothetical protein